MPDAIEGALTAATDQQTARPGRPVVVSYQPGWPERAALLIEELQAALAGLAGRFEHIGSTAV
ncbi:MAG TPA: GrpB family protein, partial [Acidimicrobiales bacterium]|nr:GrpB family protein [Acidimicrobiales bacterium]